VSSRQIRFLSLVRREVNRFLKIKRQTLGAPLLETFLYITVFGAALGSRIRELEGFDYVVFIVPGLIMMAWATNAFANNSSSILQQKFQRSIDDQLSSPASPLEFLVGFFFSQLGVLVGVRAEQFDDVSFAQTFVLQPLIFLGGVFYSASLLPEPFQTLTQFNPVFYMIGLVRYGFLGIAEADVTLSLLGLAVATSALFTLNLRLFSRGYRLRA
jgi:ABC-2 type transport system permease protein